LNTYFAYYEEKTLPVSGERCEKTCRKKPAEFVRKNLIHVILSRFAVSTFLHTNVTNVTNVTRSFYAKIHLNVLGSEMKRYANVVM
jgi:hypothetical protein